MVGFPVGKVWNFHSVHESLFGSCFGEGPDEAAAGLHACNFPAGGGLQCLHFVQICFSVLYGRLSAPMHA